MSNINEDAAKTVKFKISDLVTEHEDMKRIMDAEYVTSTELCERVSALFSNIYSDYEGCMFDFVPGSNRPAINLFFNHRVEEKGLPFACSKEDTTASAVNSTLRSTRSYSNRLINGDRYYLTEQGQGLEDFVFNDFFSTKDNVRKVNWAKLVSEVADSNFTIPQQFTQVKYLDPAKIAEVIYGNDNDEWVYGVRVIRSIPSFSFVGPTATNNYLLAIERVSSSEVDRLAKQFGLNTNQGLSIIR